MHLRWPAQVQLGNTEDLAIKAANDAVARLGGDMCPGCYEGNALGTRGNAAGLVPPPRPSSLRPGRPGVPGRVPWILGHALKAARTAAAPASRPPIHADRQFVAFETCTMPDPQRDQAADADVTAEEGARTTSGPYGVPSARTMLPVDARWRIAIAAT